MQQTSKTNILTFSPELARKIGLNQAILLNQIYYWCNKNKKKHINYINGYYWTYGSIKKWQEQFPFWSISTIKRIILNLEKEEYLISGNYNKKGYDRTKWYRVNEEKISKLLFPSAQNEPMKSININQAIQENNKGNNNNHKGYERKMVFPHKKYSFINKFILTYMNKLYYERMHIKHPALIQEQYDRVYKTLSFFAEENELDYEDLVVMAKKFLYSNIDTDFNINHFATEGILQNRFYEELY